MSTRQLDPCSPVPSQASIRPACLQANVDLAPRTRTPADSFTAPPRTPDQPRALPVCASPEPPVWRLVGLAQVDVDAVAGATALADHRGGSAGGDGDADAGGVGDAPAGPLVPADRPFGLADAAEGDGFPLPAVKAKDAIGLSDHLPPFQVAHLIAALLALAHLGAIERCGEGSDLLGGESAGHGGEGMRCGS